jgi:hypothetical protein
MRTAVVCAIAALSVSLCQAQTPSGSAVGADRIMAQAETQAAAEHKNILVVFSASWCGPCHMLDRFLKDSKVVPIFDQSLVIVRMDVGERPHDPHHANTPGGEDLMATLGGATAGYPYMVMLDPTGQPIVDSQRPDKGKKSNIGYPDTVPEIDWFMQMMQKAAPSLKPKQLNMLKSGLLDQSER